MTCAGIPSESRPVAKLLKNYVFNREPWRRLVDIDIFTDKNKLFIYETIYSFDHRMEYFFIIFSIMNSVKI